MPPEADSDAEPMTHKEAVAERAVERAHTVAALQESQVEVNRAIAAVTELVGTLSESVNSLAVSMQGKASKREVRNWPILLLCVILLGFTGVLIRGQQNHDVLTQFANCTTPGTNPAPHTGHTCYDSQVARTATVQTQIDCANEALLRYYIRAIPGVPVPPIRAQCQATLVPATGTPGP